MDSEAKVAMADLLKFGALVKMSLTNVWFLRLTKVVFKLLKPSAGDAICDVGCGAGERILLLSKYVDKAVGIDISSPLIEFLSQKTKAGNVSFHVVDATSELPAEFVGAFNKCLCMDLLEHVESPERALGFIYKIMKPGGYAVVGFPINTDYEKHHRHFNAEDVYQLASDLDMDTQVFLLKLTPWGSLVDRTYIFVQNVLSPPRGADYFHESAAFEMLTKPRKIHSLYKLVTILLFKLSQNSYHETHKEDKAANRAFILAKKGSG